MMNQGFLKRSLLMSTLLLCSTAWAVNSAQNENLSISPAVSQFGVVQIGSDSAASSIKVENSTGSSVTLGAATLAGPHANQFSIVGTDCGSSLANNASCTVNVSFSPTQFGSKLAYVQLSTNDVGTPLLTAFLSNDEDTASEAQRRFPPVLTQLKVLQGASEIDLTTTALIADTTYTLQWQILGYDSAYASYPAFFACGLRALPLSATCGDSYASRIASIAAVDEVDDVGVAQNYWRYLDQNARYFNFTQSFTVPASAVTGTTDNYLLVRFFNKSQVDMAANNEGVSLLLPGNIPGIGSATDKSAYAASDGRKLYFTVVAP